MKWERIYLAGLGSWLPDVVPAQAAVAAGRYDADRSEALDYASVCVAEDTAPPDMAVSAARTALARCGIPATDFAVLMHASLWFQGLDIWPAASYVANEVGLRLTPAVDVQQRCNGGLGILELAAAQLTAGVGTGTAAMLTTADRFGPPLDRWNMHDLNVYGDAGTALVLSTQDGFAELLATSTAADNSLEGFARGDAAFTAAPDAKIDLIGRAEQFRAATDEVQTFIRLAKVVRQALRRGLSDAGLSMSDIARVVIPAMGRVPGGVQAPHLLDVPPEKATWDFGRCTGHIGAGDWYAGLEHLLQTRQVGPGDRVVCLGGGAGFTCTVAVVEIRSLPEWW